jgi:hypothetical protein
VGEAAEPNATRLTRLIKLFAASVGPFDALERCQAVIRECQRIGVARRARDNVPGRHTYGAAYGEFKIGVLRSPAVIVPPSSPGPDPDLRQGYDTR